jgi:anti-sigma B factor antagonist
MAFDAKEGPRIGPVLLVELSGRLVYGDGEHGLDEFLQQLIGRGERALLLDCADVSAMDSEGVKVLFRNLASMEKRGGSIKLVNLAPRVRLVLETTRLLSIIETFDDQEAAVRSF